MGQVTELIGGVGYAAGATCAVTCMQQLGNGYDAVVKVVDTVQQVGIAEQVVSQSG